MDSISIRRLGAYAGWMLVLPGVLRNCTWFGKVQKSFPAQGKELLLTIDDGPDPRQTPHVLDVLARTGVRAVFFVIGKNVERDHTLCRRMAEEGHSVQNHTYSHSAATFWSAGPREAGDEIDRCNAAIEDATGTRPRRLRAPVGMANPFVHLAAESRSLEITGWSCTGNDGIAHHPSRVVQRIRRGATSGGIVLLHESHLHGMRPGERACTLSALLNTLKDDGYTFTDRLDARTG